MAYTQSSTNGRRTRSLNKPLDVQEIEYVYSLYQVKFLKWNPGLLAKFNEPDKPCPPASALSASKEGISRTQKLHGPCRTPLCCK
jgi:hypothetical protein